MERVTLKIDLNRLCEVTLLYFLSQTIIAYPEANVSSLTISNNTKLIPIISQMEGSNKTLQHGHGGLNGETFQTRVYTVFICILLRVCAYKTAEHCEECVRQKERAPAGWFSP